MVGIQPDRPVTGTRKSLVKRRLLLALGIVTTAAALALWPVIRPPVNPPRSPLIVDDVSQLNPIRVSEILAPTTTGEIAEAVRRYAGPISIGGARHSMGGQIATAGALFIDMRAFNRILELSPSAKTIRVQAGASWRQVQEAIDPAGLSVEVMQSYANFTVGGSLSVNVHGRYVGLGPIIRSVKSMTVVLADGSLVEASPTQHPEIFDGVIGGYGGLGVITEASLALTDNVRVKRHTEIMPIATYRRYFLDHVRHNKSAVFHNANILANDDGRVRAVTFLQTDEPVTIRDRLRPRNGAYWLDRLALWIESEWPFGKSIQRDILDPIYFAGEPVMWRNYEASYDAAELEPASRASSTYVLQEYFVPEARFDAFVPVMQSVLNRHAVNVVNVSIRHATADRRSLLSWAPTTDVFAFVIYYKQRTDAAARQAVGVWTRELIDAALDVGGSYYLPYQVHATEKQFRRAYPRAGEFFALKQRVDPTNRFRSEFLDRYYHPTMPLRESDRQR
jgi:FAD/FMN-containing dehydrogenase